ncbi:zinc transporter ZIP1-like [Xyrauchen texanus]|uniref:zinc transporter ZIP1-like n=1 Tax=Xyrauchen texanus TaxID=154827 RepID=UPI002241D097|nr:zinc transporter ZIP1-like [Xyrauchen texanus]
MFHCVLCVRCDVVMDSEWISSGVRVARVVIPDLQIKLITLLVLFCASLLCGFSPLWVMRRAAHCSADPGTRHRVLSLMFCFARGVFLATCLLNLLPENLQDMRETFSHLGVTVSLSVFVIVDANIKGVTINGESAPESLKAEMQGTALHFCFFVSAARSSTLAMGFLIVFVAEQMLLAFTDQSCDLSYEKQTLLDCNIRERETSKHSPGFSRKRLSWMEAPHWPESVRSHVGLRAFLLVFCLCLRAVCEGVSAGQQQDRGRLLEMCLMLLLHQGIIAVSLAFTLTHHHLRRTVVTGCLLLFSATCPAGIGLGASLAEMDAGPEVQLVQLHCGGSDVRRLHQCQCDGFHARSGGLSEASHP